MTDHATYFPPKTRPNKSAKMPYGYMALEDDPLQLVFNPAEMDAIYEALDYIDSGGSYRKAADYVADKNKNEISHQTIANIWKRTRGAEKGNARFAQNQKRLKASQPKTSADRAKARAKRKVSDAKRVLTLAEKKVDNWVEPTDETFIGPIKPKVFPTNVLADPQPAKDPNVIFAPNPGPQTTFLSATEQEVLYGGAAGGGKSYALITDPMRYFYHPKFSGLVLRRTNDELRELIWTTHELYPKAFPGAKWSERKSQWTFPSGARLWMTYLERDEDVRRYQGQAFTYVGFDELTQHPTPFAWNYMRSRLRSTAPDLPLFMRATTNPGGPGHGWVKKMFIDPAPPGVAFHATDIDTGQTLAYPSSHAKAGQPLFKRRFVPARLSDNPYLMADGNYEANLLALPENERRKLYDGDWSVAEGAAFTEFRPDIHVIEPFDIPHDWKRFRSCDYGYSSFSAVHWFAIDPAFEQLIVYRELYVTKHTGRDLGIAVLNADENDRINYGVLDSSCWHQRGQLGPSIAEEMIAMGCRWRPSDRTAGARVNGKNMMHQRLKVDPFTQRPGLVFFNTCRQIISDLPVIPSDPKGGDDIDPRYSSDHAYDSVRYGLMTRPRATSPFDSFNGTPQRQSYRPVDPVFGY